jgi:hypothetical protein
MIFIGNSYVNGQFSAADCFAGEYGFVRDRPTPALFLINFKAWKCDSWLTQVFVKALYVGFALVLPHSFWLRWDALD